MDTTPRDDATARLSAPPWALIRAAVGGPRQVAGKLSRLARTAALWTRRGEIARRLRALHASGLVPRDHAPDTWQLMFAAVDMLRFVIAPAARDYYAHKGISFGFHQLLRVLDDPVSVIDPTGLLSTRDAIVGHLLQVTHLNPIYDLQLLQMFPDGLDELERQTAAMIDGTHPRHGTIGAIIEDADYHARLLDYVRRYRRDPATAQLRRAEQTLRDDPAFAAAERAFATLPGFVAYAHALPASVPALIARLVTVRAFPDTATDTTDAADAAAAGADDADAQPATRSTRAPLS